MSAYNQRQYARMRACLMSFRPTLDGVRDVEGTITFLIGCLECPDPAWVDKARLESNELELISANAHYEDRRSLTSRELEVASECVASLKSLVDTVLTQSEADFE